MAKETPFVPANVRCPVCAAESTQIYLKGKMVQPLEVEADQHVLTYKWDNPEFISVRPNFYHIWHCPHCHYSDEKEIFRGEDTSGGRLEMLKEKVLILSKLPGSILNRLGTSVRYPAEPPILVESAINAHLLAIHIQEILSPTLRMASKIARFTLRLAWLYREREQLGLPSDPPPTGFADHESFWKSLAADWQSIPLDENQALDAAVAAYENDLNTRRTDDPKFEVNVQNLLSCLMERRGDLAGALRYTRNVFTTAAKARNGAKAAAQRGVQPEKMTALANWMNNIVDKTGERVEFLQESLFKEEFPKAKEAVVAMGKVTAQQAVEKLRELKFAEITCRRMGQMIEKGAGKK